MKFSGWVCEELTGKLKAVQHLEDVGWEFNSDDTLTVTGLNGQALTFTHPVNAHAYLDGFLAGYNLGREARVGMEWE